MILWSKLLRFPVQTLPRGREISRKLRKLAVISCEPAYRFALRHGVAAAIEHESVPFDHRFSCIVDVGAGRGQFALVARRRFPRARLHCFEPLTEARQTLGVVARRLGDIRVYGIALGSGGSSAELHVARNLDSSSLLPMTASHLNAFPGTDETDRVTVPLARLDDVLRPDEVPPPSLMKVDAQGSELEVLRGAERLLERFAAALVECSFLELYTGQPLADEIVCYMRGRGFRLTGIFSPVFDTKGRCVQMDALFERVQ